MAQQVLDDRFIWLEEGILGLYARGPLVGAPADERTREDAHRELAGLHSG